MATPLTEMAKKKKRKKKMKAGWGMGTRELKTGIKNTGHVMYLMII